MDELTKLEWNILDSLSDGKETVGLILSLIKDDFEGITTKEVAENVYSLFQRRLILEDNHKNVKLQTLLSESINYIDNVYWFGLTEAGCKYWEQYALTYSGKSINWSKSWKSKTNIKLKEGYVDGVSLEVCMQGLKRTDTGKDLQIDWSTIAYSKIEGFMAKYYKYIQGGYRATFKLKKRSSN